MKKLFQLAIALLVSGLAVSQSLSPKTVASGGGYFSVSGQNLSYTIGQTAGGPLMSGGLSLSQGFQQPTGSIALAAPVINSFTPTVAATDSFVTIRGKNFSGATSLVVTFGGIPAATYTVVNDTTILAKVAAGGSGSIAVLAAGGTATKSGFTYIGAPNISYSSTTNSFVLGTAISALTPTNTGGAVQGISTTVTTLAGSGTAAYTDGTGTGASFYNPTNLAVDAAGNIYVADTYNHRIRKITPTGVVTTLAGSGTAGFNNATGTAAQFNYPRSVAVDANGTVYVTDAVNHRIRRIDFAGRTTTFAGSGTAAFADGTGSAASFNLPTGIVVDANGNLFVTDQANHRIRKITSSGVVTTVAGSGSAAFADGSGSAASFNNPFGIAQDANGNLYIGDVLNHRIRKVTLTGVVTTFAGSGTSAFANGTGTNASFSYPEGLAIDSSGNIYVAEQSNNRIRKINPAGLVSTLAGSGTPSYVDGTNTSAGFNQPTGIAIDATGSNIYVTDQNNHRIRKLVISNIGGYSISPALPTGLRIDSATGIISGTPTQATAATNYTITGVNNYGSSSATISIATVYPAPSIASFTPTIAGNSFTITIRGTKLTGVTSVSIGGVAASNVTVLNDSTVTAIVGTGASGSVSVTNSGGTATLAGFSYCTTVVPTITVSAASTTICAGKNIVFTANVSGGGGAPTFQWKKNGVNIVGATLSTYTASGINNNDSFTCVLTSNDICALPTTAIAAYVKIKVNALPSISLSYTGATACTGVATLSVNYSGSADSVSWYNSGSLAYTSPYISGKAVKSYAPTAGGTYTAILADSNKCSSALSNSVVIVQTVAPTVIISTATTSVCTGSNITFSSTVADGGSAPTYQWKKNGVNIAGATSSSFTTSNIINNDSFVCISTSNLTCTATGSSNVLKMKVNPLPVVSLSSTGAACTGNALNVSGAASVPSIQWFVSGSLVYTSPLVGGFAATSYTPTSVGSYTALVTDTNSCFSVTNAIAVNQTVQPTITITASNTNVCSGINVTFTATANNGSITPSYQWRKNAVNISGATSSTYTSSSLANNDSVQCVLTSNNVCAPATVTSSAVYVTVNPIPSVSLSNIGATNCAQTANLSVTSTSKANNIQWFNGTNYMATTTDSGYTAAGSNGFGSASNQLYFPTGVFVDASGNTYIADQNNHRIQKFASGSSKISTGTTVAGGNGAGSAANQLNKPRAVFVDASGNLYVADGGNNRIQKFASGSTSATNGTTVAGGNGAGSAANQLNTPVGLYLDASSNLYIADSSNARIQKFASGSTSSSNATTVAGGNGVGNGTNQFVPTSVFADASSNLYVADVYNHRILKFNSGSTSASSGIIVAGGNGQGSNLNQLNAPAAVFVDGNNTIFVADKSNHRVLKYPAKSSSSTYATVVAGGNGSGNATNQLQNPSSVFVDGSGNIFIADQWNDRIQKWAAASGAITTYIAPSGGSYNAIFTDKNGCSATTNNYTVAVLANPSVSIAASANNICAGTNVTFTATPTNGGTAPSYQWKKNGLNVGSISATYSDATLNNSDVVNCIMTSNYTCLSTTTATSNSISVVTTGVVPTISITATATSICPNNSVTFTAAITNGGNAPIYQWKKNGVNVGSNSSTYTNSSLSNGDVISCVMTSNAACLTALTATSNSITISVNGATPTISIYASSNSTCSQSITFNAYITNGGSAPVYQWKKNNVNVATSSFAYTATNLVNGDIINCTLISNATCATPVTSNSITITSAAVAPSVSIGTNFTSLCASNSNVVFTAYPNNGGSNPTFQWLKNGTVVGTGASFKDNSPSSGSVITCNMTSSSSASCLTTTTATSSYTETVTPTVVPGITIIASDTRICTGTNVGFSAVTSNAGSNPTFQWKKNGVIVGSNSSYYSATGLANGDSVVCTLTSNASCATVATATSNVVTILVSPGTIPSISIASNTNVVCQGSSITFTATPVSAGATPTYQWTKNGNYISGANSTTYTTNSLQTNDAIGCILNTTNYCTQQTSFASNILTPQISNLPATITPTATPASICPGGTATLNSGFVSSSTANGGYALTSIPYNTIAVPANASLGPVGGDVYGGPYSIPFGFNFYGTTYTSFYISMKGNIQFGSNPSINYNPQSLPCTNLLNFIALCWEDLQSSTNVKYFIDGLSPNRKLVIDYSNVQGWGGNGLMDGQIWLYETSNVIELHLKQSYGTPNSYPQKTIGINNQNGTFGVNVPNRSGTVWNTYTPEAYRFTPSNSYNIRWSPAASLNDSTIGAPIATPTATTTYTVIVKDNITNCTASGSATVVLTPNPTISIAATATTICAGTSVTFTATANTYSTTGLVYQWKKNGVAISGANATTYTSSALLNGDVISCTLTGTNTCSTAVTANSNTIAIAWNTANVNTWSGNAGTTTWTTANNWCTGTVPVSGTNITIPIVVANNYPVLTTNLTIANLAIRRGATLSLNGNTLTLTGTTTDSGYIKGSSTSSVTVNSTSTPTLYFNPAVNDSLLNTLTISGTGGAKLGNGVGITNLLQLSAGNLNLNGKNLTLKSTSINNTAVVGAVASGATITGNVTVERYIPKGYKAFRQLGTGGVYNMGSIFANWQEGGRYSAGYGTYITGSASPTPGVNTVSGLDNTTQGRAGLFVQNLSTTAADSVTNTKSTNLDPYKGYHLAIMGDRTINPYQNLFDTSRKMVNATTLRSTGQLVTGTVTYGTSGVQGNYNSSVSKLIGTVSAISFVANPYPAVIDWETLSSQGLTSTYTYFDPTYLDASGFQVYVSYNGTTHVNNNPTVSKIGRYIQPGQAFWVQNSSASGTRQLVVTESNKVTDATKLTAIFGDQKPFDRLAISLWKDVAGHGNTNIDGAVAVFGKQFSKQYGNEDSRKMPNPKENLSIAEAEGDLAIDGLSLPKAGEEIRLKLSRLEAGTTYRLRIDADLFKIDGLEAYLHDAYLNKQTAIGSEATVYEFGSTGVATENSDRFRIVFGKKATATPIAETTSESKISLYPNPTNGKATNVKFTETAKGSYRLAVYNALGQQVLLKTLEHQGGTFSYPLIVPMQKGIATVKLLDEAGKPVSQTQLLVD